MKTNFQPSDFRVTNRDGLRSIKIKQLGWILDVHKNAEIVDGRWYCMFLFEESEEANSCFKFFRENHWKGEIKEVTLHNGKNVHMININCAISDRYE